MIPTHRCLRVTMILATLLVVLSTVPSIAGSPQDDIRRSGPTGPSHVILRFLDPAGDAHYGLLQEGVVAEVLGGVEQFMLGRFDLTGRRFDRSAIRLLPPVDPSKVVGFGWTYSAHAREVGGEVGRKDPLVFLKPPTVLIGDADTIRYPAALTSRVEFEGELAVIIGRTVKDATPERAAECILGYTCMNDVTARDLTAQDPEYTRGKGFDTFGPLGPWIVSGIDGGNLRLRTRLNGEVKQDARTSEMIYSIPFLISYISKVMTLNPGDVIATGTPGGSAPMRPGDTVEVEIEGIGILRSTVK